MSTFIVFKNRVNKSFEYTCSSSKLKHFIFVHNKLQLFYPMKHFIILLLLVSVYMKVSYAQSSNETLLDVWRNNSLHDTTRLEALYKYAKEVGKGNTDSLLFLSQKVRTYAISKKEEKYEAKANISIGQAYSRQGDKIEAEKYYNLAKLNGRSIGDSSIVSLALYSIGSLYYSRGDFDKALDYYELGLEPIKNIEDRLSRGGIFNNIGIIYIIKNQYDKASQYLEKSIDYFEQSTEPEKSSSGLKNLAILKQREGDYSSAINLNGKSLKKDLKKNDLYSIGYTYVNIANLYYDQKDTAQYINYTRKSYEVRKQIGDNPGIVTCLINLGVSFSQQNELDSALKLYQEAYILADKIKLKESIAHIYLQKGIIYIKQHLYDEAYENIQNAKALNIELNKILGIARCYEALGFYYKERENYQYSIKEYKKALKLSENTDFRLRKDIVESLYKLYEITKDYSLAYKNYSLFISFRDSLINEENQRELIRQEFDLEYDKKVIADSLAYETQKIIQKVALEKTQNQRLTLTIILVIVILFSVLLFNRVRKIRFQKVTIEDQVEELNNLNNNLEHKVEERTKEIKVINSNLQRSEERYRYALEASNDGIWDWDIINDIIKLSPSFYTMLGFEPYEFNEDRLEIQSRIHQDDLSKVAGHKGYLSLLLQTNTNTLNEEVRIKTKQGKYLWVQIKGKVVARDIEKVTLRAIGTLTDITPMKQKSQEILDAVLETENIERKRISREIHDGLQQTLTITSMNLKMVQRESEQLSERSQSFLRTSWEYLQQSISESREISHSLMPKEISDFGIVVSIEKLLKQYNNAHLSTTFIFQHNLKSKYLSVLKLETVFYRILQEAITNIIKYAKAEKVEVQLKEYEDIFLLSIEDNGVGFDLNKMQHSFGLKSMQSRIEAVGGFLEIETSLGKGTFIIAQVAKS